MSPGRFLVTGASGFLGRHFLAALAERGIPVRAMVRAPLDARQLPGRPETVVGDLERPETLVPAVAGVTSIVHLAARVHQMRDISASPLAEFRRVNVEGTAALAHAAIAAGVERMLLMSSIKAMGEEDEGVFDESSPCRPASPYGRSKLEAEQVLFALGERHQLHTVALRLPLVYGPGAKGNVLRLLHAADKGRRLPLGRIHNRRSMAYVGNVVAAALLALAEPRSRGQLYLVADTRPYSSRELYVGICESLGREARLRDVPIWFLRAVGRVGSAIEGIVGRPLPVNASMIRRLVGDLCFSTAKIRGQLGFEPPFALEEGLRMMAEWYGNQASCAACERI